MAVPAVWRLAYLLASHRLVGPRSTLSHTGGASISQILRIGETHCPSPKTLKKATFGISYPGVSGFHDGIGRPEKTSHTFKVNLRCLRGKWRAATAHSGLRLERSAERQARPWFWIRGFWQIQYPHGSANRIQSLGFSKTTKCCHGRKSCVFFQMNPAASNSLRI